MEYSLNLIKDKAMIPFLEYERYAKSLTEIQKKNGVKYNVNFVAIDKMTHYGIMTVFDWVKSDGTVCGAVAISPRKGVCGPVVMVKEKWDYRSLAKVRLMNILDDLAQKNK